MSDWSLTFDSRDRTHAPLRESLCTLGNGYIVTRGAAAERPADAANYPGTYLAGGYDRLPGEVAGRMVENEELVNWPNWLSLTFRPADGAWLDTAAWTILDQRYMLDLQRGVLVRRLRVRDPDGRVTAMRSRRLVHMERAHLAAIEWEITPENWSGPLIVRSALDGTVTNDDAAPFAGSSGRHLVPLIAEREGDGVIRLLVETAQSHVRMAQAARTLVFGDGRELKVERQAVELSGYVGEELRFTTGPGRTVRVEKTVAVFTSRDHAVSEPLVEADELARRAPFFSELLRTHSLAWKRLWHRCDMVVVEAPRPSDDDCLPNATTNADEAAGATGATGATVPARATSAADAADAPSMQVALRLRLFHILQTVSPHVVELDAGVSAHGWHGEAFRGHVSWDELFIFPILDLRVPEMARALLMYRFRRLGAARMLAAAEGARGARFPWRSGSSGRDETPRERFDAHSGCWIPDRSRLQAHVSSAVAHDVWHYYQATADHEFLSFYGAEMVLEIARYWASRAVLDEADGRYHLRGVVGPDEYHDGYPDDDAGGVDDNAYTNVMAAWVLRCADRVLEHLPTDRRGELCDQLELTDTELAHWREVGRLLSVPLHDGVISQFSGYERLPEPAPGSTRHAPDAEADASLRTRMSSQPDVLMLMYLFSERELEELLAHLGYEVDRETLERTVRYYLDRTPTHASPLSTAVHARVLARTDAARSWSLLQEALARGLRDATAHHEADHSEAARHEAARHGLGIHVGAMAAAVDVVQAGYLGVALHDDALWLDPRLPPALAELRAILRYRGQSLEVRVAGAELTVAVREGDAPYPIRIGVAGSVHELRAGERLRSTVGTPPAHAPERPALDVRH